MPRCHACPGHDEGMAQLSRCGGRKVLSKPDCGTVAHGDMRLWLGVAQSGSILKRAEWADKSLTARTPQRQGERGSSLHRHPGQPQGDSNPSKGQLRDPGLSERRAVASRSGSLGGAAHLFPPGGSQSRACHTLGLLCHGVITGLMHYEEAPSLCN